MKSDKEGKLDLPDSIQEGEHTITVKKGEWNSEKSFFKKASAFSAFSYFLLIKSLAIIGEIFKEFISLFICSQS